MKILIAGHHTTQVGELWDLGLRDLFKQALEGAIDKAKIDPKKIEAVFVACKAPGEFNQQLHLNALVSQFFDHYPPAMRVEGACASGGLALIAAQQALLSGRYKTVLVVGAEKMTDLTAPGAATSVLSMAADYQLEKGSTFPGLYAILAQAYMEKFGTTREMLSAVSVKNHQHALDNPLAHFRREFTLGQVSSSPLIAEPLRLLDCSPISDGASAVVLTTRKLKNKPKILSYGHGQDSLDLAGRKSLTSLAATQRAAKQAYKQAGIKPAQVEAAEVHDCFTIAEILAVENLGFFKQGDGGRAALDGKTSRGGEVAVNLSGGLKAFGHPIGATGIKQLVYIAELIEKQEIKLGLTHNVGGSGATAVVHVVSK